MKKFVSRCETICGKPIVRARNSARCIWPVFGSVIKRVQSYDQLCQTKLFKTGVSEVLLRTLYARRTGVISRKIGQHRLWGRKLEQLCYTWLKIMLLNI
uniref:Uncharacterized protein n=1 Tax=Glossina morsitans morsitans TaxID=37546 RepID=A0ABK9NGC1_GLOMM